MDFVKPYQRMEKVKKKPIPKKGKHKRKVVEEKIVSANFENPETAVSREKRFSLDNFNVMEMTKDMMMDERRPKFGSGKSKQSQAKMILEVKAKEEETQVEHKVENTQTETKFDKHISENKPRVIKDFGAVKAKGDETQDKAKGDETQNASEFDKDEYAKLNHKLSLMVHDVKTNKRITEQNRTVVQNARIAAREKIRKLRVEMTNFFNKIESDVDKKIEQMRSDDLQTLSVLSAECDDLTKKVEIISKYIDKHIKDCKPIDDIDIVRKEMEQLETSIRKLSIENTVHEYVFETSDVIHDMFKSVRSLGDLVEETEKKKTVIRMSEVKLNDKCEKETLIPFLSGLTFLSDDVLVAADFENRCMKMLKVADDKIISVFPMNTEPWDVVKVQKDQIAVTLPQKKKIQFLLVKSNTLAKGREVNVSSECHGIDSRNNKLYVTYVAPPKVEILDLNGGVIQCIAQDADGFDLFRWPGYITLSPEKAGGVHIYVTDKDKNTITRLSEDGKIEAVYGGDSLKGPRGITVDDKGHVFVCGRTSNDLCQIMLSNGKVEFILERSHGLKQPHGIIWRENRVYISSCGDKMIKSWELV